MQNLAELSRRWISLGDEMSRVIKGQERVKEQILVCMLAGGHALLEGVPGTGKTLLGLTLARLMGCQFRRVQFTPDLMPADLLGGNIFNQKTHEFEFRPGPIFTDVLLADEINRTPPRTQAALLEIMQEKSVTVDGVRRNVSPIFSVFATQNPVEFEGTYPLPEAQRDRFLLKIEIDYPSSQAEGEMLDAYAEGRRLHEDVISGMTPVMDGAELLESRRRVSREVRVDEGVRKYILEIVEATRKSDSVQIAAGPRASLALLDSSRALAVLRERDFVTPDDVKAMAPAVLSHRITLGPEAEMEGMEIEDLLTQIFHSVEIPR